VSAVTSLGPTVELSARLRPPAPGPSDLPRERLLTAFTDEPAPVTLVSAPPGSGKTSLLATWVATVPDGTIAWLSLDHHDDDPGRLWSGILGALRATGRFPVGARLHELIAPVGEVAPAFVDALVAEMAALGEPVWIVLDDVHALRRAQTLDSLALLIRRLDPGIHLVLASRSDPPVGLPRLRLEGRLRELRATDLAFTLEEAAAFLASREVDLPEAPLRALHERTEGWVAGIKIAALALQDAEDAEDFVERFSGDDHAVADYLVTEVLAALPTPTRDVLLRTSICTQISVDLAQHLTGRADAAAVLAELERDNVFTRRLGRGRDTYRYHELLRTYLAAELRRSEGDLERELHHLAADFYEHRGDFLHAMEHLARAGATGRLAGLAETHGIGAILDGRARRLVTTLVLLEHDDSTPVVVALLAAAAATSLGDLDAADRRLLRIDLDALAAGDDRGLAALAATVGAARARYTDRVDVALARLESTGAGHTGDRDRDLAALLHRGVLRLYLGRYADAVADLEHAADLARVTARTAVQVECLSFLAGSLASQGDLPGMRARAEQAITVAERRGWARSSALAHAYLLVAWAAYLRADTPTAQATTALAVASLGEHNEPDVELAVRSLEAVVAADGDDPFEAVQRYRRTFARLADAQMSPALLAYALPALVRICLDLGERAWAREFADAAPLRSPSPGEPTLLRAMLLADAGSTAAARRELDAITRHEAPCHLQTTEVMALVLAAELESRLGHPTRAQERLVEALRIAEPIDLVRPFLDSDAARELLMAGRGRFGHHEPFVQRLTAAALSSAPPRHHEADRLTPGELAVLRELPSLLSLGEIATERCVSVNTVKTHLRAIYRKLDVTGRREAVAAARRRGML
jgi:LuxR family transcriptional regulator, maltose regulon positive regulatory protein